jgi:ABC-type amino acid transport substrate-binding protein
MKKLTIFTFIAFSFILITACGTGGPPNEVFSPNDVNGRTIGALNGSPSAQLAGELGSAVTFFDIDDMLNHLRVGTIECIIMERLIAEDIISNASGVRILPDPLLEYDLRFAVAKENNQLLAAIDDAIEDLTNNGTLGALREKYFAGRNFRYTPPTDRQTRPGYLSLAVSPDSAPFSYLDENNEFTGFDVEVAIAISDHLGVELRIISTDVSELISSVWFGRADLATGWLADDVSEYVNVSESFANSAHVVIVRRR